jgi:hypothetical protein
VIGDVWKNVLFFFSSVDATDMKNSVDSRIKFNVLSLFL